jgi:hypothetical protein
MDRDAKELELRIAGSNKPGAVEAIEAAIRGLDPDAHIRIDQATGIVHAFTYRDTLEITDALSRAGFEPTAMTL